MTATQTVTLAGRTYTFTTDGAKDGAALKTLGSLFNSRGQFYGLVTEVKKNGNRMVFTTSKVRCSVTDERAALAAISA